MILILVNYWSLETVFIDKTTRGMVCPPCKVHDELAHLAGPSGAFRERDSSVYVYEHVLYRFWHIMPHWHMANAWLHVSPLLLYSVGDEWEGEPGLQVTYIRSLEWFSWAVSLNIVFEVSHYCVFLLHTPHVCCVLGQTHTWAPIILWWR